jgi:hypothetical protein
VCSNHMKFAPPEALASQGRDQLRLRTNGAIARTHSNAARRAYACSIRRSSIEHFDTRFPPESNAKKQNINKGDHPISQAVPGFANPLRTAWAAHVRDGIPAWRRRWSSRRPAAGDGDGWPSSEWHAAAAAGPPPGRAIPFPCPLPDGSAFAGLPRASAARPRLRTCCLPEVGPRGLAPGERASQYVCSSASWRRAPADVSWCALNYDGAAAVAPRAGGFVQTCMAHAQKERTHVCMRACTSTARKRAGVCLHTSMPTASRVGISFQRGSGRVH